MDQPKVNQKMWAPPPKFGTALRAARLLKGYTLTAVAKATGIPAGRLSYIERELDEPDWSEFIKVWGFLSSDPPPVVRPTGVKTS